MAENPYETPRIPSDQQEIPKPRRSGWLRSMVLFVSVFAGALLGVLLVQLLAWDSYATPYPEAAPLWIGPIVGGGAALILNLIARRCTP